ncbi:MAG: deoxyribose-phosphate aldolase, partial [Prevotella sp.]
MGIIKEKITRDIQSQTSQGRVDSSKIEQAFAKYNLTIDEAKVQQELSRIITEKVPENNTTEVKKFLLGSVELT